MIQSRSLRYYHRYPEWLPQYPPVQSLRTWLLHHPVTDLLDITGRPTLVSETFIPDNKVKSLLRSFEAKGMITITSMQKKFSLITIVKYDDFQTQNCPTNVQRMSNANTSGNAPPSDVCPTNVQRLSINNNITNNSLTNVRESASSSETPEQKKPSISCQDVIDAYHRILPECPSIRAVNDKRKSLIKTFWVKAGKITRQLDSEPFSMKAWEAYLTYISVNCRWMLGKWDGLTWKGLKADERVAQVTLTFNFATSTDPVALRTNAIALRDVVRVTNSQYAPQTWYVSAEIMSNLERYFDVNATRTVLEELLKLSGIAAIKEDAQLSGNEILIVPLTAGVIAPIVGQAIGTVADPRPFYNSDYIWRTWGAMGLMVKQDINNKYSVIHASS